MELIYQIKIRNWEIKNWNSLFSYRISYMWMFQVSTSRMPRMAISTRVGRRQALLHQSLQRRQQWRFSSKRVLFRAILVSVAFIAFVPPIFFLFRLKLFHQVLFPFTFSTSFLFFYLLTQNTHQYLNFDIFHSYYKLRMPELNRRAECHQTTNRNIPLGLTWFGRILKVTHRFTKDKELCNLGFIVRHGCF